MRLRSCAHDASPRWPRSGRPPWRHAVPVVPWPGKRGKPAQRQSGGGPLPYRPARNNAWEEAARGRSLRRVVHQGAGKIVGSTTGATPNATDTIANPIKMIEAHTPKPISDKF